ncbi:MAG: hypothetical protein WA317_04775 [Mycobacterium sp.]|uniref:hypothetical protein n=1 Tax=Mycobacterium sp. TaxID=1785 RepID=UPI003CC5FAB5
MIYGDEQVTGKTVKVKVNAPFRMVHQGEPYSNGAELTVPDEVAQHWQRSGFVEHAIK